MGNLGGCQGPIARLRLQKGLIRRSRKDLGYTLGCHPNRWGSFFGFQSLSGLDERISGYSITSRTNCFQGLLAS